MTIKQIMWYGFTEEQAKQMIERFVNSEELQTFCSFGPINFDFVMGLSNDAVCKILSADLVYFDDDGRFEECANYEDYDKFALEVLNGDGYYDEDGHYHSFPGRYD